MSKTDPSSPPPPGGQSAGRGLLFITAAKLWFMLGGAVLTFLLPRMFDKEVSAQRYGEWGAVLSGISVLNNVVVTGTIQSVARFASRGAEWVEGTKRVALRLNLLLIAVIVPAYLLAAPWIAGFLKNPGIEAALRLSTGVVTCYAIYAVFVGAANGSRHFHQQAGLDMTFTTLRAGLVLGAALVFSTVTAAMGGFVMAAATILVLSVLVVGWGPARERPRGADLLAFAAPVAAYLLVQNLLMFVDLWLVQRYVALGAEQAGAAADVATTTASKALGAYNAGLSIARLPYQLTIAVTFVIFPLISQSIFAADLERTRETIRKAVRLSLVVVVAAVAAVAARPDRIFLLIFPSNAQGVNEYLPGAAALTPLMFAYAAFSLLSIAGTALNSAGATLTALGIGIGTLALDVVLDVAAIRWALGTNQQSMSALQAAATATATAMTCGLCASLYALHRRFGASLAPLSAVRVIGAAVVAIVVARYLPLPGGGGLIGRAIGCALALAVGALLYVVMLVVTRELTAAEARALLRRGR